jgi:hypothetical protein
MDRRIVLPQQIVTGDDMGRCTVSPGHRQHGFREMLGAHVFARRVDQVARKEDPIGNSLDFSAVGLLRPDQGCRRALRLLVPRESIRTQRPAECIVGECEAGPDLERIGSLG